MISVHITTTRRVSPLVEACRSVFPEAGLTVVDAPQDEIDFRFNDVECPVALVHPLVFARRSAEHFLLPGTAVSAVGATGDVVLAFRTGLRDISTIAHAPDMRGETVITGIVLKEKYGMAPRFIEVPTLTAETVAASDAFIASADAVHAAGHAEAGTLDIADEWLDMMGMPYVQAVFAARRDTMTPEILDAVTRAGALADAAVLATLDTEMAGRLSPDDEHALFAHHRFVADADTELALQSYYRLAFYLGLAGDIPDITPYTGEDGQGE